MAEPRRGLHLARGAGGALSLARDDLERDVEARLLVAGEPDRPRAAAPERLRRPVAVEDERSVGEGEGSVRHGSDLLRRRRGTSCAAESPVHSSRSVARREPPSEWPTRRDALVTVHDDDILDFDFVDDETAGDPADAAPRPPSAAEARAAPAASRLARRAPAHAAPAPRRAGRASRSWSSSCSPSGCRAARPRTSRRPYGDYLADVGAVGKDSAKIGAELATLLTTPGSRRRPSSSRSSAASCSARDASSARTTSTRPGRLHAAHENAVESLELRVVGLHGPLDAFKATKDTEDAAAAGRQLAAKGSGSRRATSSGRTCSRLAAATMIAEGVRARSGSGVRLRRERRPLHVALAELDLAARPRRVDRRHPGGLHGNQLAYTEARRRPAASTPTETKITISTDLSFEVGVEDSGENQEVGVKVTLTIPAQPTRSSRPKTIPIIDPGETKTVTFVGAPSRSARTRGPGRRRSRPGRDEHRQQLGRVPGRVHARALRGASLGVAIAACAAARWRSSSRSWPGGASGRCGRPAGDLLGGRRDVVDFAVSLQGRIDDLHRAVDEVAAGLTRVDRRVDGSVTNTSVVRYDAYEETGGQQSASFAFLDSSRTGTVVTAIQGRDYARVYVKELERGSRRLRSHPRSRRRSSARWRASDRPSYAAAAAGSSPGRYWRQTSGMCSAVRRMKRTGVGGRGTVRRLMLVSSSSRSPLRWLHGAHEATTFSHTDVPPRERGTT